MEYGVFYPLVALVLGLAGVKGSVGVAYNQTLLVLNLATGLPSATLDLGAPVACAVSANNTIFVIVNYLGTVKVLKVEGTTFTQVELKLGNSTLTSLSGEAVQGLCDSLGNTIAFVYKEDNETYVVVGKVEGSYISIAEYKVDGTPNDVDVCLDQSHALVTSTHGVYIVGLDGEKTISGVPAKKADVNYGMLVFVTPDNEVFAYELTEQGPKPIWSYVSDYPVQDIVIIGKERVALGLKATNGILVLKNGQPSVSVGVPNVYKLSVGPDYVVAATSGSENYPAGVAVVPLAWLG